MEFILEQFDSLATIDGFEEKLTKACQDGVMPNSTGNTPGRDTQFELYIGATCLAAELRPVSFSEPDVICTLHGMPIAIAAKRVKSENLIQRRIKAASEQIQKSECLGVILLESKNSAYPLKLHQPN